MKIFSPNTDFINDFNEKGKYKLVWRLSIILSILFCVSTILTYFVDLYSSFLYAISLLICISCFIYLTVFKKIIPVFWEFSSYFLHQHHDEYLALS